MYRIKEMGTHVIPNAKKHKNGKCFFVLLSTMTSTNLLTFLEKERSEAKGPPKNAPLTCMYQTAAAYTHTLPSLSTNLKCYFCQEEYKRFYTRNVAKQKLRKNTFCDGDSGLKKGENPQLTRETTEEHYYYTTYTYIHTFPPYEIFTLFFPYV